ncbi:methionine ABC transporter ATP-binding protein [Treponema sp. OMZ 840]|uniref:methionine ABC transporter ATP-binding protein n=1 Tax=Treponema sp. OMZ 840 TaxID=244313 RepID=UPI003D8F92FE
MRIRLQSLKKTYGTDSGNIHAVRDVSLSIPSNTVYGIIGKSGAGKSTLVRLISLLEKPDSGSILYDDVRVDNSDKKTLIERRRRIGMIFQNFNLFGSRTAGENIAYPLEIVGVPKRSIKNRTAELLELVGLEGRENAPISTLSGGQKQRIAIARALANKPDILFCDEATSALDPQTTRSILLLIRNIQKQMNLTVVMITHQMEVVRDICSHVAVLDEGKIAEYGTVTDIFSRPKTAVTKDFLANLAVSAPAFSDTAASVSVSAAEVRDFSGTAESSAGVHQGSGSIHQDSGGGFVRWSKEGGKYILRFIGTTTGEPVLSRLSRLFDVEFNIRAGGIQHLSEGDVGTLVTDISGASDELNKALQWLESQGVIVEIEGENR